MKLSSVFRCFAVASVFATSHGVSHRQLDKQKVRHLEDSASPTPSLPPSMIDTQAPSSAPSLFATPGPSSTPSMFATQAPSVSTSTYELTDMPSPAPSPEPSIATEQRAALESFASATGADNSAFLDDWFDSDTHYCNYTGISCDNDGYVITLDLDQTALSGVLPESIGQLSRLRRFKALKNDLSGPLPSSLATMPELRQLNLGRNKFTGSLPDVSDGMFPMLRRLHLHRNDLSGSIPSSLCNITNLDALDISRNPRILGELPSCFGDLEKLTTLRIGDIGLTGEIPSGLCGLRNLNDLSPNTFGCDGVACGAGYYEPNQGRQHSDETPCLECNVTSNVIGSTTCMQVDGNEVVTQEPTSSFVPSQSPSLSAVPSVSSVPSQSPSLSIAPTTTPTLSVAPSETPSQAPTPPPSPSPSASPNTPPTVDDVMTASPTATPPTPDDASSSSPSSSPTMDSVIGGIGEGETGGGSSRKINKPLVISLFIIAAILVVLALFVLRRNHMQNQEDDDSVESESDSPMSPADPPMSMADSVSYLYDLEDATTHDVGSTMSQMDDITEMGGDTGFEVEHHSGSDSSFGAEGYATSADSELPNESAQVESIASKDETRNLGSGLLSPSKVLPKPILKRNPSYTKGSDRVHPVVLSPEAEEEAKGYPKVLSPEGKNSNPWLAGGKEETTQKPSKLGVYGSLFRSSSDLSKSSRASSVNTTTPILGIAKPSDANSDRFSDTDSETLSAKDEEEDHGVLGGCHAFSLDGLREKLGVMKA